MRINKHDRNGTKPLLGKGELGYDDYVAGGDAGRVYVGTGSENIALAEKSEIDSHAGRTDNPHNVTKTQVGLANVDNTSDANKPISTATQNALNAKVDTSTNQTIGGVKTFSSSPIVPTPTTGTQAANKDYVDTKVDKVTSTDNAIARYDGTTGKLQNSSVIIGDNDNVGIGVNPSAWTNSRVIQLGSYSSIHESTDSGVAFIGSNIYRSGQNINNYITSGWGATLYEQNGGNHKWYTAPSGTAGQPIPWTNAMVLNSNGNLSVGTTTDNGVDKLQVNGSINCNNKIVYQNSIIGTFTGNEWYDTGITTDTLGYNILDTFAITIYEDSYLTGNNSYQMLYKFIVGSALNSSNNISTFDIPTLSTVGHACFGGILSLRWQLVDGRLPAKIQFKVTHTSTFDDSSGKSLSIYVTKLI